MWGKRHRDRGAPGRAADSDDDEAAATHLLRGTAAQRLERFPAKVRSAGSRPMSPYLASRSASAPSAMFSSDPRDAGAKETMTSASGLSRKLFPTGTRDAPSRRCQNWKTSLRYKPRALDASAGPRDGAAVGSAVSGGGAVARSRSSRQVVGVWLTSSTNAKMPSTYVLQAVTAITSVAASRPVDPGSDRRMNRYPGDIGSANGIRAPPRQVGAATPSELTFVVQSPERELDRARPGERIRVLSSPRFDPSADPRAEPEPPRVSSRLGGRTVHVPRYRDPLPCRAVPTPARGSDPGRLSSCQAS
jgi:hypothetical protein